MKAQIHQVTRYQLDTTDNTPKDKWVIEQGQ